MRTSETFTYPGAALKQHWRRLHAGDREPFPTAAVVKRLAGADPASTRTIDSSGGAAAVARALEAGWRAFHHGDYLPALRHGVALGALGVLLANKAAAMHTLYIEKSEHKRLAMLREAVERGEQAVRSLPEYANAHFALALVLGRYSQRISILEALAAGHAGRIREHLERTLALEPKHAEAHIALGLYHAELVKTLGSIAARLTYGASAETSLQHFRRAVKLAPGLVTTRVEFAHGLHLLGSSAHRDELAALGEQAGRQTPMDRTEQLDLERLREAQSRPA
jgi:hypothetical protein